MPSRREQIEMTPEERRAYIRSQHRLIIVSNGPNGFPHPMPMNFLYDDEDRFVVTTFRKSQKVLNYKRDPRAALLIESGRAYHELKSVLAYANAEVIDDHDQVLAVMLALGAQEAAGQNFTEAMKAQIGASAAKRVIIRFDPETYISWDHSKLGGHY